MKSLKIYIQEKLIIKNGKTNNSYNYFPETNEELKNIIKQRIKSGGNEVDLNDIDVSKITDMSRLFYGLDFNGNISAWDVSNVDNMFYMFYKCKSFNQDISSWNVSNVTSMSGMFALCKSFNQDISNWDVSNVSDRKQIFDYCPIEEKYKPKFK